MVIEIHSSWQGLIWTLLPAFRASLSIHQVFEVALKSPSEMLSATRLAHGRSAVHCEGWSHWAIPSAHPAGSKMWLTWLYFHLILGKKLKLQSGAYPRYFCDLGPSRSTHFPSSAARYLDLRSRSVGLILVFLYVPSCHFTTPTAVNWCIARFVSVYIYIYIYTYIYIYMYQRKFSGRNFRVTDF